MASACNRFFTRASISSLRTAFNTASRSEGVPLSSRSATSRRASTFVSRSRAELGCVQSLLPLHSAVSVARLNSCLSLNSRNCRSLSQGSKEHWTRTVFVIRILAGCNSSNSNFKRLSVEAAAMLWLLGLGRRWRCSGINGEDGVVSEDEVEKER